MRLVNFMFGIWGILCGIFFASPTKSDVKPFLFLLCGGILLIFSLIGLILAKKYQLKTVYKKTDSLITQLLYISGVITGGLGTLGILTNSGVFTSDSAGGYRMLILALFLLCPIELFRYIDYNYNCSIAVKGSEPSQGAKIAIWIISILVCILMTRLLMGHLILKNMGISQEELSKKLQYLDTYGSTASNLRFQKWGLLISFLIPMLLLAHYRIAIFFSTEGMRRIFVELFSFAVSVGLSLLVAGGIYRAVASFLELLSVVIVVGIVLYFFSKESASYIDDLEERVGTAYTLDRSDSSFAYLTDSDLEMYSTLHSGEFPGFKESFVERELEKRKAEK